MTETQQLLAEYAKSGSETAFRELVNRYVNLVYSTAYRLVDGDAHLAQDVAQLVFINLARKGRALSQSVMLGGWLHQNTYHVATRALRSERRRQSRECEAAQMKTLHDDAGSDYGQLAPVLDEAITQLGAEDRAAILLRFFEQKDFRAVGVLLGSTEDAARMRVNRALEKLQGLLKRRGVTLSAAGLGVALAGGAVSAAPAGLAAAVTGAALTSIATGSGTILPLLKFMATTKIKAGITALLVAGAAATLVVEHQSKVGLRQENQALRDQVAALKTVPSPLVRARASRAPRLPAPAMISVPAAPTPEVVPITNLNAQISGKKETIKLTAQQLDPYFRENGRTASSLLAAFRTSGDATLLEEAMQKFPNDPQVGFEAAMRKDAPPEERRKWLDLLKQSAPENSMVEYLSAGAYLKSGQIDRALEEMMAADSKKKFEDYALQRGQEDEEVFRSAGYPVAQSKMLGWAQLLLPQLIEVKQLSEGMIGVAGSYRQAGDEASAQAALEMVAKLGQRYSLTFPGETEISQLVGIAVERMALRAMDPATPYGANGQTAQDRIDELVKQRGSLQELGKQTEPIWDSMSDQDWISYHDRWRTFGEESAQRWLIAKFGQKP